MARYTQAEFARECGVSSAKISMYKKRKKIFVGEDGYFHDTLQVNAAFLNDHRNKQSAKTESATTPLSSPIEEPKIKSKNYKQDNVTVEGKIQLSLDQQKKTLEIEKLKVDTRLQELKEEKIRGEVVPISLAQPVFQSFHQAVITSQKESIEVLLIEISMEYRLTGEQLARLRGKLLTILNEGSDKAVTMAQRNLTMLVEEFSIKKEVGEHE